eukprot:358796-Chlamydomonas_euryale.AAC.15
MEATNLERVRLEWRDSERIVQSEAVSTSAPASTSGDTGQATSNCTADSEALQQSGFMLHKVRGRVLERRRGKEGAELSLQRSQPTYPCVIEKRDTLAGIAIKYNVSVSARAGCGSLQLPSDVRTPGCCLALGTNGYACAAHVQHANIFWGICRVQVADLKRFNGLLSETAMYGRESLLVPTRLTPVG